MKYVRQFLNTYYAFVVVHSWKLVIGKIVQEFSVQGFRKGYSKPVVKLASKSLSDDLDKTKIEQTHGFYSQLIFHLKHSAFSHISFYF